MVVNADDETIVPSVNDSAGVSVNGTFVSVDGVVSVNVEDGSTSLKAEVW